MTEEKNEAPAPLNGEAGNISGNIETSETKTEAVVEKQPVNNQPKPSHLRQRWKRKPSAGTVATIREDTTPQPKELKTVEIPTAERLNYPKETFGRDENRNRRPRERDERRGGGERCGCRNRREGFDKDDAHREETCGCREEKAENTCVCHSLLKKAKRFFGKLFGNGSKLSEGASCGCRQHGEQKRFDRGASRPGGYRRPHRRPGNRSPQNRGE
jgi:hypothetical protein